MKAKLRQKQLAENLRRQGLSLSEIRKQIPVAKSSLSLWLREVTLTTEQQERLQKLTTKGQKAGAEARHNQRLARLEKLKASVQKETNTLFEKPFFLLGLALYWAEGTKQKPWSLSGRVKFINSDPNLILLMRRWLVEYCGISVSDMTYRLYVHINTNTKHAQKKWAQLLGVAASSIPMSLKKHQIKRRYRHNNYIGLICLTVKRSTWLNRRIDLWTKAVTKEFLK